MSNANIITLAPPGTPEWLAAHKGKIGGSTVASILGIGRSTPLRVYAELTGKVQVEDISNQPRIRRGVRLEPVVRELYQDETGRTVLPSPGLVQHPKFDWLAGTPDGLVDLSGVLCPWEAKTDSFYSVKKWTPPPLQYQVQVQFYMVLLGVEMASLAAMPIDEDEDQPAVIHQDIVLDPIFCDYMMDRLVTFRDKHWLADIPPEPDFTKDRDTIRGMFPHAVPGTMVEMSDEAVQRWAHKEQLASEKTAIEKELKAETAWLEAFMGTAEWAMGPGYRLKFADEFTKGYTVEPKTKRQIRKVKAT